MEVVEAIVILSFNPCWICLGCVSILRNKETKKGSDDF